MKLIIIQVLLGFKRHYLLHKHNYIYMNLTAKSSLYVILIKYIMKGIMNFKSTHFVLNLLINQLLVLTLKDL